MGWIRSRVRDESGFALVLALAVIVALGTAVASTAYFTTSNFHDSTRSRAPQWALALAEAGLNMAYSTLELASKPSMASAVSSTAVRDVQLAGGFATYYGTWDATSQVWSLTGVGKAFDPSHPGSFI